ncbi:MAG: ATP-binding cassette domain-containing protein [Spirochaetales bacterium]|nr:ATP-binding cassette domain-containing protein [Spirochaetales bacterium]
MSNTVLSFSGISKRFGDFQALHDVGFDLKSGEVVGLVGANGAGKSTLLKIAAGVHPPSGGGMVLFGRQYIPSSPQLAKTAGIASVFQELNLFLNMSVAENIFVDDGFRNRFGLIDWKAMREAAAGILKASGLQIAPSRPVSELSIAQQQMVEIVRALAEKPKILLLDEPTASLSEDQTAWLFARVREAVAAGTAVLYVSHRLDEVSELCDRCVILRDGRLVATLEKSEIRKDLLIRHMVGREIASAGPRRAERAGAEGGIVFECEELSVRGKLRNISFNVRSGEILGIAGLVGAGRTELLNAVYGILRPTDGVLRKEGDELSVRHPRQAIARGIAPVSEDRKKEGLFFGETVTCNLNASAVANRSLLAFIDRRRERKRAGGIAGRIALNAGHLPDPVERLSGGNQQKVVFGRALLTEADLLLLDEPTRGVDVGAREDIYAVIEESAAAGKGVILVSSDWEEIVKLADRALVMRDGQIVGELTGEQIDEEAMLHLCTEQKQRREEEQQARGGLRNLVGSLFSASNRIAVLAFLLAAVFLAGSVSSPFFLNRINISNLAWQSFVYVLLTIGQLAVIICGGIDLSVSAAMTIISVIGIKIYQAFPDSLLLCLAAMLAAGVLIGLLNGFLVVRGRINAFIATLGVGIVLQGVSLVLTTKPIAPAPQILKTVANGSWLGIPIVVYLGLALFAVFSVVLRQTRFGRRLYAVGESDLKARWSGLPVGSIKIGSYLISTVMASLAAFYLLGRTGGAEPIVDPRLTLDSIAYCLIGGATLAGGRGSLGGSLITILLMIMLLNVLGHSGVGIFYQQIVRAVLLLVIVIAYNQVESRRHTGI